MDRRTELRLKKEEVIWLGTVGSDGRPQAVPVWFLWDGRSFLIYSQDGIKVRHIQANRNVELHLNSDPAGDDLVRVSGQATIAKAPPAHGNSEYLRKYRRAIKNLGMTPASFAEKYHNPIRVSRIRFH